MNNADGNREIDEVEEDPEIDNLNMNREICNFNSWRCVRGRFVLLFVVVCRVAVRKATCAKVT